MKILSLFSRSRQKQPGFAMSKKGNKELTASRDKKSMRNGGLFSHKGAKIIHFFC